jgi:GT2 family glycosyltransferase
VSCNLVFLSIFGDFLNFEPRLLKKYPLKERAEIRSDYLNKDPFLLVEIFIRISDNQPSLSTPSVPLTFLPQTINVDLSILIINYRNSATLADCLDSIYKTTHDLEFEVIVVDNDSREEGLKTVQKKFSQVCFIKNKANKGFAKANNQAVEISKGDTLLFLNPDTRLTENVAQLMIDQLKLDPLTGALGPKVLNNDGSLQYSCRTFPTVWTGLFNRYSLLSRLFPNNRHTSRYLMKDFDHEEIRAVDWVSGCCMMVPKSIFKKIGGFDENHFLFNEDVDLCLTLKHHGYRTLYFPHAKVFHEITTSNHKVPQRIILKRHLGMSHYIEKHFIGNPVLGFCIHAMIAVRYFTQLLVNMVR